jgi:hypothetical protein
MGRRYGLEQKRRGVADERTEAKNYYNYALSWICMANTISLADLYESRLNPATLGGATDIG